MTLHDKVPARAVVALLLVIAGIIIGLAWSGPDLLAKITAGVAIATLVAVGYQISIGRQELEAVQEDLANNKRLIDDAFRRPRLYATFRQVNQLPQTNQTEAFLTTWAHADIFNDGERPSMEVKLELLVPLQEILASDRAEATIRVVRELHYAVLTLETLPQGKKTETLFPNNFPTKAFSRFQSPPPRDATFVCLWRLYDEYGKYPKDDYGRVTASANLLPYQTYVEMPPV